MEETSVSGENPPNTPPNTPTTTTQGNNPPPPLNVFSSSNVLSTSLEHYLNGMTYYNPMSNISHQYERRGNLSRRTRRNNTPRFSSSIGGNIPPAADEIESSEDNTMVSFKGSTSSNKKNFYFPEGISEEKSSNDNNIVSSSLYLIDLILLKPATFKKQEPLLSTFFFETLSSYKDIFYNSSSETTQSKTSIFNNQTNYLGNPLIKAYDGILEWLEYTKIILGGDCQGFDLFAKDGSVAETGKKVFKDIKFLNDKLKFFAPEFSEEFDLKSISSVSRVFLKKPDLTEEIMGGDNSMMYKNACFDQRFETFVYIQVSPSEKSCFYSKVNFFFILETHGRYDKNCTTFKENGTELNYLTSLTNIAITKEMHLLPIVFSPLVLTKDSGDLFFNPKIADYFFVSTNKLQEEDTAASNDMCLFCLTNKKNILLDPCGHIVMCIECRDYSETKTLKNCPICRKKITKKIEAIF